MDVASVNMELMGIADLVNTEVTDMSADDVVQIEQKESVVVAAPATSGDSFFENSNGPGRFIEDDDDDSNGYKEENNDDMSETGARYNGVEESSPAYSHPAEEGGGPSYRPPPPPRPDNAVAPHRGITRVMLRNGALMLECCFDGTKAVYNPLIGRNCSPNYRGFSHHLDYSLNDLEPELRQIDDDFAKFLSANSGTSPYIKLAIALVPALIYYPIMNSANKKESSNI